MIDGVIRAAVEEAIRFIRPGAVYACSVNDHRVVVIRIGEDGPVATAPNYFVACGDCLAVIAEDVPLRRVVLELEKHTKDEAEERDTSRVGVRGALADSKRAPMATPNQRKPKAGEVLPPNQRASWAREKTEHDK